MNDDLSFKNNAKLDKSVYHTKIFYFGTTTGNM